MASKIMIYYLHKVGFILGVNANIAACSAVPLVALLLWYWIKAVITVTLSCVVRAWVVLVPQFKYAYFYKTVIIKRQGRAWCQ